MTTLEIAGWILGFAVMVALAFFVYWMVSRLWNFRLMRCPETGLITLVAVVPEPPGAGKAPGVMVQKCDLWPEREDCARGCLARYEESTHGYRVNLHALRPFERR